LWSSSFSNIRQSHDHEIFILQHFCRSLWWNWEMKHEETFVLMLHHRVCLDKKLFKF
jgi:hypothetical protein